MFILNFFKKSIEWMGLLQKNANIVFLGLDNAGKTTLLYMLQSDRYIQTDSTFHPHLAEITIGNITFNSYDLGGHAQARRMWKDYCAEIDGIIFVIDVADLERLPEAKEELDMLMEMKELEKVPFVVFANKIDRNEALREGDVREYFGLNQQWTTGKDPMR